MLYIDRPDQNQRPGSDMELNSKKTEAILLGSFEFIYYLLLKLSMFQPCMCFGKYLEHDREKKVNNFKKRLTTLP